MGRRSVHGRSSLLRSPTQVGRNICSAVREVSALGSVLGVVEVQTTHVKLFSHIEVGVVRL
jgi:hypothetical protein